MQLRQWKYSFLILYMAGFLAGILFVNIVVKDYVIMTGIFHEYFLNQYVQVDIIPEDYLLYLLQWRGAPFATVVLAGLGRWKKVVVCLCLFWTGFSGGVLLTAAVLRLGIRGILLCLVGLFPQIFFYLMSYTVLLWYLYTYPSSQWKSEKTVFVSISMILGIASEVYLNPVLVKLFLEKIL